MHLEMTEHNSQDIYFNVQTCRKNKIKTYQAIGCNFLTSADEYLIENVTFKLKACDHKFEETKDILHRNCLFLGNLFKHKHCQKRKNP